MAADDVDFAGDAVDEPLVDFVGDAPAPLRTLAASEPSAVVEAPSPTSWGMSMSMRATSGVSTVKMLCEGKRGKHNDNSRKVVRREAHNGARRPRLGWVGGTLCAAA